MTDLRKILLEAIGQASMCWNPHPSGVFNSDAAFNVADKLEVEIEAWAERALPASAIQPGASQDAIHAARVEGAEAAIDTAIRAGACWCKDKKAEAARIVSARWPSTVEQKEGVKP